ncbi:MAG: Anhydromuropeptide permease [Holosporales bacterium]
MDKLKKFLLVYYQKDLFYLLFLGISSGIPFLLILSTLSYWLNELNFSPSIISLFTAVSLPYSLKAFWAPYIEAHSPPFLTFINRKRAWGLISQFFLCLSIVCLAHINPVDSTKLFASVAVLLCFFAATQDIVIDGIRIEQFGDNGNGPAASFSAIGFHLGKLASGCGTLYLASWYDWCTAYQLIALGILPGFLALCFIRLTCESLPVFEKKSFKDAFKSLNAYKNLKWMLFFVALFKVCDSVIQGTSATFLYELGLSKIEFADLTKVYGTVWVILGAVIGGAIIEIFGVYAAAFIAASIQGISCLFFAIQAHIGYDYLILSIVIAVENFASGFLICSLVAIISAFVDKRYAMSHYTLLYAFGSLSRVVFSAISGYIVEYSGWFRLYLSLVFFVLPISYIIYRLKKESFDESREK